VNEYLKDDYTWYDVLSVRRDMGFFGTATRSAGKNQQITAGFEIKHGGVDAYDKYYTSTDIVYNEGKMLTLALFAQDELKFLNEKLIILAGLRLDKARYYDGSFRIENPSPETMFMINQQVPDMPVQNWKALCPRISAQYKFNKNTRVYTMFARGFRPSVLDDLCRSGRIKGGFKLANPALQPEYLNNFEAGADFAPVENIQTSVSVYYSHGSDFQYYVTNGTTIDMGFGERPVFIRANISEINIYGAEAEVKYNPGNKLQLFANYAFTHSQISAYNKISGNDTIDLSGKFLTDVPDHIFSAGISWFPKILNISLMAHYNGSMFINDLNIVDEILLSDKYPAYSTIDLKLWRKFFEKLDVALNIQNLMDTKYFDSKYAVCPGRFITVQLGYKW
jgi:iron complex outermembrane receptor protein